MGLGAKLLLAMVVYIEYVILDNFIIDFIILFCTAKLTKLEIKKWRIFASCILGVAFAFLTPYISIHNVILFIIKLLMGVILVYVALPIKRIRQFLLAYFIFIFLTFLLGGICYGLQGFVQTAQIVDGAFTYTSEFPVSLIILAVFVFVLLGNNLYNAIKSKKKFARIAVLYNGAKLQLNALIDSGNQLIDGQTKLPISFLSRSEFIKKFGAIDFRHDATYENLLCKTITGTKLLDTILIDKLIILENHSTILNARIALYDFDCRQNFNAIISENMVN